jgi:hypothetical protein
MDRSELIRLIVLNEICDGYQNVDQMILADAAREGAECGNLLPHYGKRDGVSPLQRRPMAAL